MAPLRLAAASAGNPTLNLPLHHVPGRQPARLARRTHEFDEVLLGDGPRIDLSRRMPMATVAKCAAVASMHADRRA